jgi:hypothetical protein
MTEKFVNLIQKRFVALTGGGGYPGLSEAERAFVKAGHTGRMVNPGGNQFVFFTATGKPLGLQAKGGPQITIDAVLQEFDQLPEADRKPKDFLEAGGNRLAPPGGATVLNVYYRTLFLTKDSNLELINDKNCPAFTAQNDGPYAAIFKSKAFREAAPDHMWLTEADCNALVPAAPRKGDKFPLPPALLRRLTYHLQPVLAIGEPQGWPVPLKDVIQAAEIALTVEDASAALVNLRLEGFVKAVAVGKQPGQKFGYEPRLLGRLEYDVRRKAFTRFDLLALGDAYGQGFAGHAGCPWGSRRNPYAISFELCQGKRPVDRLVPLGFKEKTIGAYLGTEK